MELIFSLHNCSETVAIACMGLTLVHMRNPFKAENSLHYLWVLLLGLQTLCLRASLQPTSKQHAGKVRKRFQEKERILFTEKY